MAKKITTKKTTTKKPTDSGRTIIVVKKDTPKKDYEIGYKKPSKKHQFKPGNCANPYGRTGADPTKQALKQLSVAALKDAIEKTMTCDEEQIVALINDPKTTIGHKIILRAALNAAESGDYSKFDHILERAIGKVSSNINMNFTRPAGQLVEDKEKVKQVLKEVESEF